jgi:PAS domain S-box-containing protein
VGGTVALVAETEHKTRSADPAESRLEFETLISDLSSRFINLPAGELDGAIENALREVCELLGIELAVLWQWSATAPDVIAPTHAYPPLEGLLPPEPLREEQFPWIRQEILAGRVVALSSLEQFPAEASVDREYCRHYGVKSHLSLALSVGGESPVGLIGFNTLGAERHWPDAVVKRLQLVAQVFTNALARRRTDEALRDSEERLSLAADSADAGLWVLDYATQIFWVTPRTRSIFGFSPDEIVTMERLEAVVHPDDLDLVREAVRRSAQGAEDAIIVEYRIVLPSGRERWIVSRGRPHSASAGKPDRLMGVSIDISERKRSEEALVASQSRLASGAELAGLAFYEVDFGSGTMYSDDRLRDLCGVPLDRVAGLGVLEFWMERLHPDDRPHVLELRRQLHGGDVDQFSLEYRYLHPDWGELWIQHLACVTARDASGQATRARGVFRDVTESKRAEEELRDLSRRLITAQEEERALLARELHDDVSQRLAVLAIDVGRAELAAADGEQAQTMQAVREGLVSLSEDVHSLAYQLHPSVLEELGLVEALRAECGRRARMGTLDVTVDFGPLPSPLAAEVALCLFRVAQEALNNVVHHAAASCATVTLRQIGDGLVLAVSDDGAGFEPGDSGKGMHLGLAGMRERVRLVRGTLDIESAPGRGTKVIAWVPVGEDGS